MGFFDRILGKKQTIDSKTEPASDFAEGDVFYIYHDGQYQLYKLLKEDKAYNTYHVLCYQGLKLLPDIEKISELSVAIYHAPVASSGFRDPKLFAKSSVTDDDLVGYFEYLRQTDQVNELTTLALDYYKEANRLADLHHYREAIQKYSIAIELVPVFFEALDNRGFCKMDIGDWGGAIEDFEQSLIANPDGHSAIFSIGECYMKMAKYPEAKTYFMRAQALNPDFKQTGVFLKSIEDLIKG